jgi:5'-deoxynucleotidase YfbR-like HD superfamily hydrolase
MDGNDKQARAKKIRELVREFDDQKTINAKFAYLCDKCDASLRAIYYKKSGYDPDITNADPDFRDHNKNVAENRAKGLTHMEEMWYEWWMPTYTGTIFAELVNTAREQPSLQKP